MECKNCEGKCCTSQLPLNKEEINTIKDYIKENNISGFNWNVKQNIFNTEYIDKCPFLNPENHMCSIYEIRPEICRQYNCNNRLNNFNHTGKKIVNFYEEFCPDIKILYKPDTQKTNQIYQEKKRKAGVR